MSTHELTAVAADGVELAGSLWAPDARAAHSLVAMHPGFGPTDRDSGGLFPPIRAALLDIGVAVCSFDKRGVGGSGGSWLQADIPTQTTDLVAGVGAARALIPGRPTTGLFGHSQGGWAALGAAGPAGADFVICNSTPGVTPRAQQAFSTRTHLAALGLELEREIEASATFDEVMWMLAGATPFEEAKAWMSDPSRRRAFADLADADAALPTEQALWDYVVTIVDYDPADALRSIRVPLLVVYGGSDDIVPVDDSADRFAELVPPHLLTLHVLAGGDHRLQLPGTETFTPGYLEALTGFVAAHT